MSDGLQWRLIRRFVGGGMTSPSETKAGRTRALIARLKDAEHYGDTKTAWEVLATVREWLETDG